MNRKEEYTKYLMSDKWMEIRLKRLKYDFHECALCGNKAKEVHHKRYVELGKEELKDLVSLCKVCHREFHKKINIFSKQLKKKKSSKKTKWQTKKTEQNLIRKARRKYNKNKNEEMENIDIKIVDKTKEFISMVRNNNKLKIIK